MLEDALDEWRDAKTISIYGWARWDNLGPSLVMPTSILDRIVDCAHRQKITTAHDLKKETGWTDAEQFSEEIIAIIKRCTAPLPLPFASTPLRPSTSNTVNIQVPATSSLLNPAAQPEPSVSVVLSPTSAALPHRRAPIKCGACGKEGHNGESTYWYRTLTLILLSSA